MGYVIEFRDGPSESIFNMAPETAVDFFRAKGLRPTFSYLDMVRDEHDAAFTVAKMLQMDLLDTTRKAIDTAISDGWSIQRFRSQLGPILQSAGWWGRQDVLAPDGSLFPGAELGSAYRLNTIYRSNLQSAYAVGQWERIEENRERAPWLMYDAVDDHRTREEHARFDNLVLPVTDSFWLIMMPPNGYNCRCGVIQLTTEQLQELGLTPSKRPSLEMVNWTNPRTGEIEMIPAAIDPGWDHNPGLSRLGDLQRLSREKAQALPDDWSAIAMQNLTEKREFFEGESPEMEWHRAGFDSSPRALKTVIQNAGRVEVQQTRGKGAYARAGRMVEMGDKSDRDNGHHANVWRHEFGHILDYQLGKSTGKGIMGYYSSAPDWTGDAMKADALALEKSAGKGRKSKAQQARAEERAAAYEAARVAAVEAKGEAFPPYLERLADDAGIDRDAFLEAVRRETLVFELEDSLEALGAGGRVRLAQALTALQRADGEQFVESLLHLNSGDHRLVMRSYHKSECLGSLSDAIGASTKNKVCNYKQGFPGHSTNYYNRSPFMQGTEVFANLTAMMGHPLPVWSEIARRFLPDQSALWTKLIDEEAQRHD